MKKVVYYIIVSVVRNYCQQFLKIKKKITPLMSDIKDQSLGGNYQSTLTYYKQKVDSLQKQRQAWLAKLDQCCSRMNQKQQKQQKLREHKNQNCQTDYNIIHHTMAKYDEELSTLSMDRQNQNLEFQEAEQLIKMRELSEEFPVIAAKCLPCVTVTAAEGELIDNDLNLHNKGNGTRYGGQVDKAQYRTGTGTGSKIGEGREKMAKTQNSKSQQQFVKGGTRSKNQESYGASGQRRENTKKTLQQVMKMQIIETQKLNAKEIAVMEEQQRVLQQSIAKIKQQKNRRNEKQRGVVKQFNKKYTELEKKHKDLAESYFALRRQHKQRSSGISQQTQKLQATKQGLQDKINEAMRIYQKQNKAKQALILRKSADFQQDYKAKMRAKERNLQALKENYQKMQELCIDKVRKLEATVERARFQLQDAQERRRYLVDDLREQLKELEKRVNEQRIEKAKIDLRMKQKMIQEKQREQAEREREQKQRRSRQRDQLIKMAYRKTALPETYKPKSKSKSPTKQLKSNKKQLKKEKQNKKRATNNAQSSSGEEDSLEISDLDNIRKQITELEQKIARGEQQQQN